MIKVLYKKDFGNNLNWLATSVRFLIIGKQVILAQLELHLSCDDLVNLCVHARTIVT